MDKVDINKVREFYNSTPEIWSPTDHWHQWSYYQLKNYLSHIRFLGSEHVLNAGSGGNSYGIECNMTHVDIAEEKLKGIPNSVISSVEAMPFSSEIFDKIICVGSVINYCDASAVIAEFSRVLKRNGNLILEFESSGGFEYKGMPIYKKSAGVVTVKFQGEDHVQWLYSLPYIKKLLVANSFSIDDIFPYQILSSLALHFSKDESSAVRFSRFDKIARKLPWIAAHANNFILYCRKL